MGGGDFFTSGDPVSFTRTVLHGGSKYTSPVYVPVGMFAHIKNEFTDSIRIHTVGVCTVVRRQHKLGDIRQRGRKNKGNWNKYSWRGEA